MGILYKEAPSIISKGKAKLLGEMSKGVSSQEKAMNRCSFDVVIEKKLVDGNPTKVCRINNYNNYPAAVGNTQPLQEEFTDLKKFAQAVYDKIVTVGEEL